MPDSRVRSCGPQPLAGVRVDEPGADAKDPNDIANRAALLRAIEPLGLGARGAVNVTTDFCSASADLLVPLRRTRSGRLRPGARRLRMAVTTTEGVEDRDVIVVLRSGAAGPAGC